MQKGHLTIKQAADFLDVSPLTLRNWDNSGKFSACRHPLNNYRVYKLEELEELKNKINASVCSLPKKTAPKRRRLKIQYIED